MRGIIPISGLPSVVKAPILKTDFKMVVGCFSIPKPTAKGIFDYRPVQ
jgi:hypothetical protein